MKDMAKAIIDAQTAEIEQLATWIDEDDSDPPASQRPPGPPAPEDQPAPGTCRRAVLGRCRMRLELACVAGLCLAIGPLAFAGEMTRRRAVGRDPLHAASRVLSRSEAGRRAGLDAAPAFGAGAGAAARRVREHLASSGRRAFSHRQGGDRGGCRSGLRKRNASVCRGPQRPTGPRGARLHQEHWPSASALTRHKRAAGKPRKLDDLSSWPQQFRRERLTH